MDYSYKTFFQKLYLMQRQKFTFREQCVQDAEKWQSEFRTALYDKLGLNRLKEIERSYDSYDQQSVLTEEIQEKGYLLRKYIIQTLPTVYMPFYMLIPDGVNGENPACGMIAIPAHGANKNTVCGVGKTEEEKEKIRTSPMECYGRDFVKRGYVVFCPDPPGYGERIEPLSCEDKEFMPGALKNSLDCSCKDLAQTAEAMGLSLIGLGLWDLMRLLDFACCTREIKRDKNVPQIGCAGFSGGGQYTMWLAALEKRIRLAVVSGYVHGYYDSILECHLCSCNYIPELWQLCDISDICSLIAPRPLFIENGTDDVENGFPGIEGPRKQVEKIRKAYRLFQSADHLLHYTPEGKHCWYGGCYGFVERNLGKEGGEWG